MPVPEELKAETVELIRPLAEHFGKSKEHKAATLAILCATTGTFVAMLSKNESHLLDNFTVANKQIRAAGSEVFMKVQEFRNQLKSKSEDELIKLLEELEKKLKEQHAADSE